MRSEAQRRADTAYKARHADEIKAKYKLVAAQLPIKLAEQFKQACTEQGTTMNAVLTQAVKSFLKNQK